MPVTASDIVNRALELAVVNVQVTGTNPGFDGSAAGDAAGVLYTPVVDLLLRQMMPVFARRTAALLLSGTPPTPWTFSYVYPTDCMRLLQVRPSGSNNDPRPVRAAIFFDGGEKAIGCNLASAIGVYTSNGATEDIWDWAFAEAVAHRLSSPLAMALSGRPDFARELLEESAQFAQMAEAVDEV